MLRFITARNDSVIITAIISIHLMLRFILDAGFRLGDVVSYFNTSHVTVYQSLHLASRLLNWNFNTSHVTVYQWVLPLRNGTTFQYISCYGLSRKNSKLPPPIIKFQYIPCYGLSQCQGWCNTRVQISIHPMLRFILSRYADQLAFSEFQYIPCYGLSFKTAINKLC